MKLEIALTFHHHETILGLSAGTAAEQIEKDRTVWTYLTPNDGHKTAATRLKCSDFFGKQTLVGSEGFSGTASASPANQILYEVWAARADDNYQAGTVRIPCYVTVEYDVIFTYPLTLGPS